MTIDSLSNEAPNELYDLLELRHLVDMGKRTAHLANLGFLTGKDLTCQQTLRPYTVNQIAQSLESKSRQSFDQEHAEYAMTLEKQTHLLSKLSMFGNKSAGVALVNDELNKLKRNPRS